MFTQLRRLPLYGAVIWIQQNMYIGRVAYEVLLRGTTDEGVSVFLFC